ncbi:hypothetical protein cyc_07696 [Cyclospora cayetanensis]|uniref:AP2/ERF domain-containing protein n=1 Tax=Cyclospora cayetanensis TaxID=88456 RepID=A0A1D3D3L5_9EIME|nr:hypothetical protein cyc_07696 [Cyclospora cayetanensis]
MASFSAATSNPDPEANTATAAAAIGACDVRGVYHDIRNSAWAATIGFNGKTLKRSFAVGKHGFSAALKLAIQARKKLETLRARCNRGRGDGEACNSSRVQIGQQAVEAAGVNQHQSQTSTSSCLAVAASGAVAAAGGAGSSEVPSSTSMSIPGVSLHAGPGATRAGAKNLISTFLPLPPCGNLETAGSSSNRANSGSCNALLEGRFGLKSTVAEALTVLLHQSDLQRAMLGSSKFQCTQQELLRQPFLLREQQLLLQQFQLQQQQQLMDGQLKDEQQATVLRAAAAAAAAVGLPGITTTHLTDSNAAVDAVTALLVRPCPPTVGKQEEFRDAGGEAAAGSEASAAAALDTRERAPATAWGHECALDQGVGLRFRAMGSIARGAAAVVATGIGSVSCCIAYYHRGPLILVYTAPYTICAVARAADDPRSWFHRGTMTSTSEEAASTQAASNRAPSLPAREESNSFSRRGSLRTSEWRSPMHVRRAQLQRILQEILGSDNGSSSRPDTAVDPPAPGVSLQLTAPLTPGCASALGFSGALRKEEAAAAEAPPGVSLPASYATAGTHGPDRRNLCLALRRDVSMSSSSDSDVSRSASSPSLSSCWTLRLPVAAPSDLDASAALELAAPAVGVDRVDEAGDDEREYRGPVKHRHREELRNFLGDFCQQEIQRSWLPFQVYRLEVTMYICVTWGIVLLALGIALLIFALDATEVVIEYNNSTPEGDVVPFNVQKRLNPPVYVYYRIQGFYANYRPYVKDGPPQVSSSYKCDEKSSADASSGTRCIHELSSLVFSSSACIRSAVFIRTREEALALRLVGGVQTLPRLEFAAESGLPMRTSATEEAFPCGAQSVALFNDDLELKKQKGGGPVTTLSLNTNDVPYKWDFLQFMVKKSSWTESGLEPWILPSDPKFRVWLHPPVTPDFQKLYGIITEALVPNVQYYAVLSQNKWPAGEWGAKKAFVIASLTPMGGPNMPLALFTIVTGILCILLVVLLWVMKKMKVRFVSSTARGVDLQMGLTAAAVAEAPASSLAASGGAMVSSRQKGAALNNGGNSASGMVEQNAIDADTYGDKPEGGSSVGQLEDPPNKAL